MNIIDKALNRLSKYSKKDEELEGGKEEKMVDVMPMQIRLARAYHGMHEVGHNKTLKKLLGFNPATTPWCAGFVNAIEKMCRREGTGQLLARSFLKYGEKTETPKLGDIVVFRRGDSSWQGHVGYYVNEDNNGILVLGGNQNNKVCYKYYPASKLLGYRRVN